MSDLPESLRRAIAAARQFGNDVGNAIGRDRSASASTPDRARPAPARDLLPPDRLVRDFSAPLPSRVQIGPYGERMTQILPASAVARSGAPEQGIGAHDASDAVNQYARTPGLLRDPVTMARMTDIGVGQGVAPGRPQPDAWRVPPEPASFPMQAPPPVPFFAPRPPNESRQYLSGGAFGAPMDANRYARDVAAMRAPPNAMRHVNAPAWVARNELGDLPPVPRRIRDPFAR